MEQTEKFLLNKGLNRKTINKVLFTIEEVGMLIHEKNQGKKILAEYTLFLKPDKIEISIRDDGKINDITDEDTEIKSFRSYIFSLAELKIFNTKKYLTVTSLNRNIFYVERLKK